MKKKLLTFLTALSFIAAAACQYEAPDVEMLAGFRTPYISKINGETAWTWRSGVPAFFPPSFSSLHLPITVELSSGGRDSVNCGPLYGVVGYGSLIDLPEDSQLEIKLDYSTDNGTTWVLIARKLFRNARQNLFAGYILGRNLLDENLAAGTTILLRLRCGPPGFTDSAIGLDDLAYLRAPEITGTFPDPAYGTVEFVHEFVITGPRRPGRN